MGRSNSFLYEDIPQGLRCNVEDMAQSILCPSPVNHGLSGPPDGSESHLAAVKKPIWHQARLPKAPSVRRECLWAQKWALLGARDTSELPSRIVHLHLFNIVTLPLPLPVFTVPHCVWNTGGFIQFLFLLMDSHTNCLFCNNTPPYILLWALQINSQ